MTAADQAAFWRRCADSYALAATDAARRANPRLAAMMEETERRYRAWADALDAQAEREAAMAADGSLDTAVHDAYLFAKARLGDQPYPAEGGWLTAAQCRNLAGLLDYAASCYWEGEQGWHTVIGHVAALWTGHPEFDREWAQWLRPAQP